MAQKKKGSGVRGLTVKVKTAKKRSKSSAEWLRRQLNDPYVVQAKMEGYRSRAAFKLIELDEKFSLLHPGDRVVDLGAAPGGWAQVAVAKVGAKGKVVGCDLLEVGPIPGATIIVQDFTTEDAPQKIKELLGGRAHLIMSDMAANTTGHGPTDHLRIVYLCELAYEFAREVLAPGGRFVCKVLKGGTERELLKKMQKDFASVKHAKPASSRADSAESYVVATGFRG
jgi:23S rRNA (uridine2552-2'-O)-methyltransferase